MCDVRRGEEIGTGVDVWALGVTLYKCLFLKDLFGTPGKALRHTRWTRIMLSLESSMVFYLMHVWCFAVAGEERLGVLNFDPVKKLGPNDLPSRPSCAVHPILGHTRSEASTFDMLCDILRGYASFPYDLVRLALFLRMLAALRCYYCAKFTTRLLVALGMLIVSPFTSVATCVFACAVV